MKKSKQAIYLLLIFTTLMDIILLCYITFYPTSLQFSRAVFSFDLILCIVLWIEFIYSYKHSNDKRKYLEDNFLSIIGMLPVDFVFLRALRLIKLFHLIRVYVLSKDDEELISNFLKRTYLDKIIVIAILFIFICTVLIRVVDSNINNIHTAVWYIIVSMTSTGYGDIVPATTSGYVIGAVAMIGGIMIFSTITAVISSIYVSKISRHNHDSLESKIDDLTAEIDALNKKIDELKKDKKEN